MTVDISGGNQQRESAMDISKNTPAIIDIDHVCWGYRKGEQAVSVLDKLQLRIRPGEIVAILGQSGSGKSSLLNLISGIEAVDSGSIRDAGTGYRPARRAR